MWLLALLSCLPDPPAPPPDPTFVAGPAREGVSGLNILLILLDDVATDRIGVYAEHTQPAHTPTIDALAAQGIRFTEAYANPVCSPSRASLLTGRHARRTGIAFNVRPGAEGGLNLSEGILPELLDAATPSYTSVGVGKWHLQPRDGQTVQHPIDHGFDRYEGAIGNLVKPDTYTDYTWYAADGSVEEHASEYLTTREIDTIRARMHDTPEPWFIWGALHAPHGPWTAPPASLLHAPLPDDAAGADLYDAMLEAADTELARLLADVDLSDTLVVLLGDNGTPKEMVRPPLRSQHGKGTTFEAGVRVPWIVVGPGIPAGQVSDALVSVVDLFPTLAEVAGVQPERPGVVLDGVSLWPVLSGSTPAVRRVAYSEKAYELQENASQRMVRDGRYKLMERGDKRSFFDLQGRHDDGPDRLKQGLTADEQAAYDRLAVELQATKASISPEAGGCL